MITSAQLLEMMDGRLVSDDLNTEGNAFAQYYYDDYLNDFDIFTESSKLSSAYHVKDTWDNYEKIKRMIDQKCVAWKALVANGWAPQPADRFFSKWFARLKKRLSIGSRASQ